MRLIPVFTETLSIYPTLPPVSEKLTPTRTVPLAPPPAADARGR